MRKFKIFLLCCCLILSVASFAESKDSRKPETRVNFTASTATVNNGFPNIFRMIKNVVKRIFGKNQNIIVEYKPIVTNLTLSRTEIVAACFIIDSCSNNNQLIEITTEAYDRENDVLIYYYQVSGGKIIGKGAKVVWDLSGVKAGTYTITVGADDGCGFCGVTKTETVIVKECPDCK
ncbi:hypothetical protein BH10ACI1_BH10ACI1_34560 [soil metagenome]